MKATIRAFLLAACLAACGGPPPPSPQGPAIDPPAVPCATPSACATAAGACDPACIVMGAGLSFTEDDQDRCVRACEEFKFERQLPDDSCAAECEPQVTSCQAAEVTAWTDELEAADCCTAAPLPTDNCAIYHVVPSASLSHAGATPTHEIPTGAACNQDSDCKCSVCDLGRCAMGGSCD